MNKMDEMILVLNRDYLFENEELTFQGALTEDEKVGYIMTKFQNCLEVRRGDAEVNEGWKQPITYVIIRRGDEIFIYERLKGGGEARLHSKKSIGIGGHMNRVNGYWDFTFELNVYRELFEELSFSEGDLPDIDVVGLINDDENEVGRVHIGILAVIDLPETSEVRVRETDKIKGGWIHKDQLLGERMYSSLETWSQFAVGALFR